MLRNTLNTFITATLIMLLGVSSTAQAMVPADSRITSTSTLTLEGLDPLTATVSVTVGLQRSKPLIALKAGTDKQPNPSSAKWINETTESLTYTYTITTEANGPAEYTVNAEAAAEAVENLNKTPRVKLNKNRSALTITLGATAVLEVAGSEITVPSDGKANNPEDKGKVNGIQKDDKVLIKGGVYTVLAVEDLGHDRDATITLDDEPGNLETGTPIAEQQEFTVDLGEIRLKDTDKTQVVAVTITVSQGKKFVSLDVTTAPSFTVIAPRGPKMQIWVRNLSQEVEANPNPAPEGVKTKTYPEIGGNTYFSTHDDPPHPPGSILEYLVTVRAGNEGPLTDRMYQVLQPEGLEYVDGKTYLNSGEQPIADDESKSTVFVLMHEGGEEDNVIDTDQTAYITYQMKVIGGDGGGDGGSFPLTTGECKHDADGRWAPDMNATKCKGVKWNAANGQRHADGGPMLEHNPVCWKAGVRADAGYPWVVGNTQDADLNEKGFNCRTKCAGESGDSFANCNTARWYEDPEAMDTKCTWDGKTDLLINAGAVAPDMLCLLRGTDCNASCKLL